MVYTKESPFGVYALWGSCDEDEHEVALFPRDELAEGMYGDSFGYVIVDHLVQWGYDVDRLPIDEIKQAVYEAFVNNKYAPRPDQAQ